MATDEGAGPSHVAWKAVAVLLTVVGFLLMMVINRSEANSDTNQRQDADIAALKAWAQENSRNVSDRLSRIELKLDRVLEKP